MWRLARPCPGGPVLSASLHRCADPHLQGHRPCQRQHGARRKSGPGHLLWVQAPGALPPCPGLPCDTPTSWWGDAGHRVSHGILQRAMVSGPDTYLLCDFRSCVSLSESPVPHLFEQ